jgi:hypothetical protein
MTLQEFVKKNEGKFLDWDGAYGNQCTDLFRFYVRDVLNLPQSPAVQGAADIWTTYLKDHYERIYNTPSATPQAGDIVIWNRKYGPYGHVAIALSSDVFEKPFSNTLTCFSQNDPVGKPCITRTYKYTNIYGWLRPKKGLSMPDTKCQEDLNKSRQETLDARSDRGRVYFALNLTTSA